MSDAVHIASEASGDSSSENDGDGAELFADFVRGNGISRFSTDLLDLERVVGESLTVAQAGEVETFQLPRVLLGGILKRDSLFAMLKVRVAGGGRSFRFDQGSDIAKKGDDAHNALHEWELEIERKLVTQFCESSILGNVPVPLVIRFTRGFRRGIGGVGFEHDFYCGHRLKDGIGCVAHGKIVCLDFEMVEVHLALGAEQCSHIRGRQAGQITGNDRRVLLNNVPVKISSTLFFRTELARAPPMINSNREHQSTPSTAAVVRNVVSEENQRCSASNFKTNSIAELDIVAKRIGERNAALIGDSFKLVQGVVPRGIVIERTGAQFSVLFVHRPNIFLGPSIWRGRPLTMWDMSLVVQPYKQTVPVNTWTALVPMDNLPDFLLAEMHTTSASELDFRRMVEYAVRCYGGLTRVHLSDGAVLQVNLILKVGNKTRFGLSEDKIVQEYKRLLTDFNTPLPEGLICDLYCKTHFLKKVERFVLATTGPFPPWAWLAFQCWISLLFQESDVSVFNEIVEKVRVILSC